MNPEENILAYLRGEMEAEEKQAFEQQLAQDESLAAELSRQQQLWSLMGELPARQQLKASLNNWMAEAAMEEAPTTRPLWSQSSWRFAAIAAGVLLLAALVYLLIPAASSPQELYADYYQTYSYNQYMGAESEADSLFQAGVKAYKSKAYEKALRKLSAVQVGSEHFYDAQMLLGATLMQKEKYAEAIPFLQQASQNPRHQDDSRWYLAWAHLMAGNAPEVRQLFDSIAQAGGYKSKEAKEVLEKW